MLAVIVVVPAPTPVTTPAELTVATDVELEVHATVEVMFSVLAGWLPWLIVPIAVSCAVLPVPKDTAAGDTVMESICVDDPQPTKGNTRPTRSNALKHKRPCIELSSRYPRADNLISAAACLPWV
jgi:hypothetical protein